MKGRNLLALACSGLSLLAATGCAREPAPRASIKDTPAVDRSPTRVRGYVQRVAPVAANPPPAAVKAAVMDPVPGPTRPAPTSPVTRGVTELVPTPAPPEAPVRVVNPDPVAPREAPTEAAAAPPAKAEPQIREAAAGNVVPGAVPSINSSGSLTARIMEQARQRIAVGDVVRAREWLMSALNGSRPEVLHELARTFDPNYLGRINHPNAVAEPARARALYEEAIRLGVKSAGEDLSALLKTKGVQP